MRLQLRRVSDAGQALKHTAVFAAVFAAAQLAPLVTRVLTSVPVDVSDVQVSYKVRTHSSRPLSADLVGW